MTTPAKHFRDTVLYRFLARITGYILLSGMLTYCAYVQAEPVQFSLTDLNGKTHTLKDYEGKWLVINYWATWCPPCLDEIPELVAFHDKHKDRDAVVLGMDFEDVDEKTLRRFIDENFISYPIFRASTGVKSPFGIIHGLPTTFLISPQGELIAQKTGSITMKELEESIAYYTKQLSSDENAGKVTDK